MTTAAVQRPTNPIARAANGVPAPALPWVVVAATLTATALAAWYAYDQDTLFPTRHLPRTWTFVAVFCGVGLVSLAALLAGPRRLPAFVAAFGAGALVFGGANLLHKPAGAAVLVLGAVAWGAVAAMNQRRGLGSVVSLAGLLAAWALLTAVAVAIAALIEN
jgi:hypothetical protein